MEENYNHTQEDIEYLKRRAKRKRMILEKKKRRRRRLIAQMVIVIGLIVITICAITSGIKRNKEKKEAEQQAKLQAEMLAQAEVETVPEEVVPEEVLPVYEFVSNEDTKNLYSDKVISSNAILVNEETDTIIASKGAKERISPASMTKVLTVLVAAEHITEEQLDDTFRRCCGGTCHLCSRFS